MRRFVVALLLASALVSPAACTHTPPASITDPRAVQAYRLEDAVDAVAKLQTEAIAAERAHLISVEDMKTVVRGTMSIQRIFLSAIDSAGSAAAVYSTAHTALVELEAALPPAVREKLKYAFTAALTILGALGGGTR